MWKAVRMATCDTLPREHCMNASAYLAAAEHDIDRMFGEGYSAKNPEFVAAYKKSVAMGFDIEARIKRGLD